MRGACVGHRAGWVCRGVWGPSQQVCVGCRVWGAAMLAWPGGGLWRVCVRVLRIGVHSHMWLHLMVAVLLPSRCLWPAWMLIPPGGALFQVRARSLVLTLLAGP